MAINKAELADSSAAVFICYCLFNESSAFIRR